MTPVDLSAPQTRAARLIQVSRMQIFVRRASEANCPSDPVGCCRTPDAFSNSKIIPHPLSNSSAKSKGVYSPIFRDRNERTWKRRSGRLCDIEYPIGQTCAKPYGCNHIGERKLSPSSHAPSSEPDRLSGSMRYRLGGFPYAPQTVKRARMTHPLF